MGNSVRYYECGRETEFRSEWIPPDPETDPDGRYVREWENLDPDADVMTRGCGARIRYFEGGPRTTSCPVCGGRAGLIAEVWVGVPEIEDWFYRSDGRPVLWRDITTRNGARTIRAGEYRSDPRGIRLYGREPIELYDVIG